VARRVRETDRNTAIAFLTSHPEHVFAGYEVSALRYLMKPVAEADLFPLLDLVRESGERERRFLVLEVDGEQRRVEEEDILCLEARGHTVVVETASGPVEVRTTPMWSGWAGRSACWRADGPSPSAGGPGRR